MIFKFSLSLLSVLLLAPILHADAGKPSKVVRVPKGITPQSCLDYKKQGFYNDGYYSIYDCKATKFITVFCDMNSEAGAAWTLVESFSLDNAGMHQFMRSSLRQNAPVNPNSPNWKLYRMSLNQMNHVKSQSSHWRVTCSFKDFGVDYTDYARATFRDFDIMTFTGIGVCKKVEYINIRGYRCVSCTSKWWQKENNLGLHVESWSGGCQLNARPGARGGEDNFGLYAVRNKKFRCTAGPSSTTNWWFGGYQ